LRHTGDPAELEYDGQRSIPDRSYRGILWLWRFGMMKDLYHDILLALLAFFALCGLALLIHQFTGG
jgi:hypothetical protein